MPEQPKPVMSHAFGALFQEERVRRADENTWGIIDAEVLPPRQLEIQPTAHCHRVCSFCSHINRNQRGGDLPKGIVARILSDAESMGTEMINFSGGGEPLTWASGDLGEAMAQARSFARVSLTTSGDQLWDDDRGGLSDLCLRVLENCNSLLLNVPGADDDSLAKQISGGPSWSRTKRMLQALVEFSRDTSQTEIHCVVVITRDNLHKLTDIDRRFSDLGIESIYYKPFKVFEDRNPSRQVPRQEVVKHLAAQTGSFGPSKSLSRLVNFFQQPSFEAAHCWVNRLGFGVIIDPLGDVYLCTPTVGDRSHAIGNVYRDGLGALWTSEARFQVMRALSSRSVAGGCPTDCRFHSHNRSIASYVSNLEILPIVSNAGLDNLSVSGQESEPPARTRGQHCL